MDTLGYDTVTLLTSYVITATMEYYRLCCYQIWPIGEEQQAQLGVPHSEIQVELD